jgi:pSer/pThr/pTyr-binding forkhead associated (FHA) protein
MPAPKGPSIRGARLVGAGAPIELGLGTFTVGRGMGCDVRLEGPQVSRAHATIVIAATAVTVEDQKTVNGTFVNGREVKTREPLKSGDVVRVGAVELRIEVIAS